MILGAHCHRPYGTDSAVLARVYRTVVKPFITALNKYPKIPAVLHYSGVLLYWIERNKPEVFSLLQDLIARKQVELLSGGFYESAMPLLPSGDRLGQIEMLTTYLRKAFGKRPAGALIPPQAWEQSLVSVLHTCGMAYTFLNEEQFARAGQQERGQPCISEDRGRVITIFPISTALQTAFEKKDAAETLDKALFSGLRPDSAAKIGENAIITVFPREFGAEIYSSGAEEKAVNAFFEGLSQYETEIEYTLPQKTYKNLKNLKKIYFPDEAPKQFLIKHDEANNIYAKMLFTHLLIDQIRGDKARKKSAAEEIWKSQSCDLFAGAGINDSALRAAAYKAILNAEKTAREVSAFIPCLTPFDFDYDGEEEYLFQGEAINFYVDRSGGGIFELDYLAKSWNYLNTALDEDDAPVWRRYAFTDYICPAPFDGGDGRFLQAGNSAVRALALENFEPREIDRVHSRALFHIAGNETAPFGGITGDKLYHPEKGTITVHWALKNKADEAAPVTIDNLEFSFVTVVNLSFPSAHEKSLRVLSHSGNEGEGRALPFDERGRAEIAGVTGLEFQDVENESILSLSSKDAFDAWIEHRGNSKDGETVPRYQFTRIILARRCSLPPDGKAEVGYRLRIYD
jgi:hypothetical protein